MSGSEYLETLRDDRSVYLYGERVQDVTVHPAFRNSARSLARLYDALHKEELRDVMTTVDRFGIRTHRFFAPSYSASELLAARDAIAAWARLTYGFMGALLITKPHSWPRSERTRNFIPRLKRTH